MEETLKKHKFRQNEFGLWIHKRAFFHTKSDGNAVFKLRNDQAMFRFKIDPGNKDHIELIDKLLTLIL